MQDPTEKRLALQIRGVVQGVGYRPFVYEIANRLGLSGFVRNSTCGVEIEVQGPSEKLECFSAMLSTDHPPLARIEGVVMSALERIPEAGFRIESSASSKGNGSLVAADSSTCFLCLRELFDPLNRRHRYPFINCTNCGPRFSIIKSLPYDRKTTTMAGFRMCRLCQEEYDNPADRRFHAQPNACQNCGPELSLHIGKDVYYSEEAINGTLDQLRAGRIVAIKGLSGFHLVCDATNNDAVMLLRQRKKRANKPLAVMMRDVEMLSVYCKIGTEEAELLSSSSSPIVLLESKNLDGLAKSIAEKQNRLGVMFPYTPLQHMILCDYGVPLVFTSANKGEEPIVIDFDQAEKRLAGIADSILDHNRDIYARYDDSVLQISSGGVSMLRRSRGFAPLPIRIPLTAKATALAFGGQLKNTFCLISGDQAFLSPHIGDLENLEAEAFFCESLDHYMELFRLTPEIIACDEHPGYLSTELAQNMRTKKDLKCISVQHHHAHIVSCMIENGLTEPCLGVAFDGSGFGSDGTFWGGEFLLCQLDSFERLAHLEYFSMPGGTQAILQPWRMALSYIMSLAPDERREFTLIEELVSEMGANKIKLVSQQILTKLNSPMSSSCGRFLDAVSALLGICRTITYEGQAAIELEARAWSHIRSEGIESFSDVICESYSWDLTTASDLIIIGTQRLFCAVNYDLQDEVPINKIALRVHVSLAKLIYDVLVLLKAKSGINSVCFSGGVFQNQLLVSLVKTFTEKGEFDLYFHHLVPMNDGGLSLGQAVVALAQCQLLEKNT